MAVYGKEYLWNRHIYVIFIAFSQKKNKLKTVFLATFD